jgi:hypothetical protein
VNHAGFADPARDCADALPLRTTSRAAAVLMVAKRA